MTVRMKGLRVRGCSRQDRDGVFVTVVCMAVHMLNWSLESDGQEEEDENVAEGVQRKVDHGDGADGLAEGADPLIDGLLDH